MGLCHYCETVEIAWHQVDRKWFACEAKRDDAGGVLRVPVRSGHRTVMRPVPDPDRPHYPHVFGREASACPAWTAEAARKELAAKGRRPTAGWRARDDGTAAGAGSRIPAADMIPTAAPLGGEPIPAAAPVVPVAPEEPEALLPAEAVAAWKRAEAAIRCELLPTRVLLWGPPGTGKTELPHRIAEAEGWRAVYQLMTEETPATELLGHLIVQGGSTVWCDGSLGRAIRASHAGHVVLVVDEIGRASQDALSACLLAMTNAESLRLTLRSGEVISPDPARWHVVATSNDAPDMLPPALADRLHLTVELQAPNPELVRSMTTVEARRLACAASREYSVRALLTYDRLRAAGMARKAAAELVWEPAQASSFQDAARIEGLA